MVTNLGLTVKQNILLLENDRNSPFFEVMSALLAPHDVILQLAYGVDDFKHRIHREAFDLVIIHPFAEGLDDLLALIKAIQSNLDPRQFFPIFLLLHSEDLARMEPKIPDHFGQGITGILRTTTSLQEQKALIQHALHCKSKHNLAAESSATVRDYKLGLHEILHNQLPDYDQLSSLSNLQFTGRLENAETYAGDYINVLALPNNQFAVLLMDAQASSYNALCTLFYLRGLLEAFLVQTFLKQEHLSLGAVLSNINKVYSNSTQGQELCMLSLYLINSETGALQHTSAGQPNGWLFSSNNQTLTQLDSTQSGPPLGVENDFVYKQSMAHMMSGDQLILMTNGIWDQKLSDPTLLNLEQIHSILSSPKNLAPSQKIDAVYKQLYEAVGSKSLADDAGMLIISY